MKRFNLSILFLLIQIYCFAAANIFQNGGVDNNWGTIGNWSLGAVPTASDGNTATFNGSSPNCTVNTSARVCNVIDFTGYTNTITMTQNLTVSGNITLSSTMTFAGSGNLAVNATATLTTNGKSIPNFNPIGTLTLTLADNCTVTTLLTVNGSSTTTTINGNTLNISGNANISGSSAFCVGTTLLNFNGTGTLNHVSSNGVIRNNLTINTSGTITLGANLNYNTGTLTYTAGTVVTTGNAFAITETTTLNTNGISWNNVTFTKASGTLTLSSNLTVNGTLTLGTSETIGGTGVFTANALTLSGNNMTITLQALQTYTVTNTLTATASTSALRAAFASSSGTDRANLVLNNGGSQDLSFVNFTRINAIGGKTLATYKGTITDCVNIRTLPTDVQTISY